MALTVGFSAVFYVQTMRDADLGFLQQQNQLRDNLYFTTPDGLQRIRDENYDRFRNNLIAKLALVNAGMLVIGGAASYLLARRSLRPLEQALESQGRFTSDAAHELRTPLTAMKIETELALRQQSLSGREAREVLHSNLEEIGKLETLTGALLRLARSSETIDTSFWQDYKLQDILDTAVERWIDKAKAAGITLKLPKSKAVVHGDPDQLVELFVPLIANAVKYSAKGSEVVLDAREEDNKVWVDVIDHGAGIAEVDLPHIFERFYRADQSRNKTQVDGYGLGLSLAQTIARNHGGRISVKSEYGKGSTFTVELPLA